MVLGISPGADVKDDPAAALPRLPRLEVLQAKLRFADARSPNDNGERSRQQSPAQEVV